MKQVERHNHYPEVYGHAFDDVFTYYQDRGESDFTWSYGKSDRFRVNFKKADALTVQLDAIVYDGDWSPQYTPVYKIEESLGDEPVHISFEPERGTVPYDALTTPELVLRALLHQVQDSIRLRARNGLK